MPWIHRRRLHELARAQLKLVGLELDPGLLVAHLSAGERQLVEVAKAVGAQARLLILDEPTTSLSARECERLFALLSQLRQSGVAIIYISHALEDVLRLADELVVLRDGAVVACGPARTFTHQRLVSLMVGRQLNPLYPERRPPLAAAEVTSGLDPAHSLSKRALPPAALEVKGVTQAGVVRNISFRVAAGEVLCLSGLMGAGRSELARILLGLERNAQGEVRVD